MFEDYKEMYAAYDYAKSLENGSYAELKQRLKKYNELIVERDAQREGAAGKRLRTSWLITTILFFVCFFIIFVPKNIEGFLVLLLASGIISAFFIFVFLSSIHDLVYQKNIKETRNLEELKFRWLVVSKELEKRDAKEAERIIAKLEE